MVDCTGLENRHPFIADRGFESLLLCKQQSQRALSYQGFFVGIAPSQNVSFCVRRCPSKKMSEAKEFGFDA